MESLIAARNFRRRRDQPKYQDEEKTPTTTAREKANGEHSEADQSAIGGAMWRKRSVKTPMFDSIGSGAVGRTGRNIRTQFWIDAVRGRVSVVSPTKVTPEQGLLDFQINPAD